MTREEEIKLALFYQAEAFRIFKKHFENEPLEVSKPSKKISKKQEAINKYRRMPPRDEK